MFFFFPSQATQQRLTTALTAELPPTPTSLPSFSALPIVSFQAGAPVLLLYRLLLWERVVFHSHSASQATAYLPGGHRMLRAATMQVSEFGWTLEGTNSCGHCQPIIALYGLSSYSYAHTSVIPDAGVSSILQQIIAGCANHPWKCSLNHIPWISQLPTSDVVNWHFNTLP